MKVAALAVTVALAFTVSGTAQDRTNPLGNGVAPMATTDPEMMIYRVAGVVNSNATMMNGVATSFMCYSNSAVAENVRIRILNWNGEVAGDIYHVIQSKRTVTFSTHSTASLAEDALLAEGKLINQGTAAIIATSKEVYCSAMLIDAATTVPNGIALHMVRFNPAPGTVE